MASGAQSRNQSDVESIIRGRERQTGRKRQMDDVEEMTVKKTDVQTLERRD